MTRNHSHLVIEQAEFIADAPAVKLREAPETMTSNALICPHFAEWIEAPEEVVHPDARDQREEVVDDAHADETQRNESLGDCACS